MCLNWGREHVSVPRFVTDGTGGIEMNVRIGVRKTGLDWDAVKRVFTLV